MKRILLLAFLYDLVCFDNNIAVIQDSSLLNNRNIIISKQVTILTIYIHNHLYKRISKLFLYP